MLLALWPLFIAMPEPSNYALLDQRKRDERRLAKHKKQVEEELARQKNGPKLQTERGLVADTVISGSNIAEGTIADGILGYVALGRGLSEPLGASITKGYDVSHGTDEAIKRKNDEAFILILANL